MKKTLVLICFFAFIGFYNLTETISASPTGNNIPGSKAVLSIYIDENGYKWFGTMYGLAQYDGYEWTYYTTAHYLKGNEIYSIVPETTSQGTEIWLATDYGATVAAYNIDGITAATTYTIENGLLDNKTNSLAIDTGHVKYIGIKTGISYFHNGKWDSITYNAYPSNIPNGIINGLATHNNLLYVATSEGIGRFSMEVDGITGASRWTNEFGMTPLSGNILSVYIDNEGDQWFGTDVGAEKHIGLSAKENWLLYTTDEGLVNNHVNIITTDDDGAIWFGTNGGISKFANDTWTNYTTTDGLVSDTVYDIDFDNDGSVWFATNQGISQLLNGGFETLPLSTKNIPANVPVFLIKSSPISSNTLDVIYESISTDRITIKLYNISGIPLKSKSFLPISAKINYLSLDIEGISSGFYIVQIIQGKFSTLSKIIIK